MNHQNSSDTGEVRPVRAFQTDPCWYESHWYGPQRASTPAPIRRLAMRTAVGFVPAVRRLIAERSTKPQPVPQLATG